MHAHACTERNTSMHKPPPTLSHSRPCFSPPPADNLKGRQLLHTTYKMFMTAAGVEGKITFPSTTRTHAHTLKVTVSGVSVYFFFFFKLNFKFNFFFFFFECQSKHSWKFPLSDVMQQQQRDQKVVFSPVSFREGWWRPWWW